MVVVKQYQTSVDNASLETVVNNMLTLDESKYTESSWEIMLPVLQNAQDVLSDVSATQNDIESVFVKLTTAYLSLRLKPSKDLLAGLIKK